MYDNRLVPFWFCVNTRLQNPKNNNFTPVLYIDLLIRLLFWIKEALTVHAFGALGLIQYWMRRVNFSCRAISLIFFSPQNMHASVISITPKYIEILFNFNQYYRSTWKAFAFCFIIPERYINFPFLWRMGVTTPADPHWNGRY